MSKKSPDDAPQDNEARWCAALPLLAALGAWRRAAGYDPVDEGAADMRSSGESNAALARIRQELAALGVAYHWCATCAEYHLILGDPAERADG